MLRELGTPLIGKDAISFELYVSSNSTCLLFLAQYRNFSTMEKKSLEADQKYLTEESGKK